MTLMIETIIEEKADPDENMPNSYKFSETGDIPSDWEIKSLGQLAEITMGQSPIGASYNRNCIGVPLINGPTEFTKKYPVKIQWTSHPTKLCKAGDILLCVRGSSTGRINISDDLYCIGRGVASIRAKRDADQTFISFQLHSAIQKILTFSAGSTFPNIDGKTIRSIEFLFPSIDEQQAIAAALSDIDSLINSLDQLIAKKRNIKLATMQRLLTGKQRLPGFSDEWRHTKLKDIGKFSKGKGIKKEDILRNGVPCIRYGEIYTHHNDVIKQLYSFIPKVIAKESQVLKFGDLLFTLSGETANEIGKCVAFVSNVETYAGGDIAIFSPKGPDSIFLGYLMNHSSITNQKLKMAQGDAVVHISARNLATIEFYLPPLDEQIAIAKVLTDMDTELSALEQQLTKARNIKQGTMQELLTGRIRLT